MYILPFTNITTFLRVYKIRASSPLTSIYGTFSHNGKEYSIGIPNSDNPVLIKIILDNYDEILSKKIALMNIESKYKAQNIKLIKTNEDEKYWLFEMTFDGLGYKKDKYESMHKQVKVFKEDGYDLIEDIK